MKQVLVGLALAAGVGCTKAKDVPCTEDTTCDFLPDGTCRENPATGTGWCAAPDTACPSGLRWDSEYVGEGVAGECVPEDVGPSCPGRLAWISTRDGNPDVFVGNDDGSDQQNLTHTPEPEEEPRWSHDGSMIAYVRTVGTDRQVWIMAADGSGARAITTGFPDNSPRWSPDDTQIAFVRKSTTSARLSVWVVATSDATLSAVSLDSAASDYAPAWSPDGARVAFVSRTGGSTDLYVAGVDGLDRRNLSSDGAVDGDFSSPAWSPDGSAILYLSYTTGDHEVFSVDPSGGGNANLSLSPSTEDDGSSFGDPQWSSDATRIYFVRTDLTTLAEGLVRMNSDGTGQVSLGLLEYSVAAQAYDSWPVLSPRGERFAWVSERDSPDFSSRFHEIYVADLPAGPATRLTNTMGNDEPAWRPCPNASSSP